MNHITIAKGPKVRLAAFIVALLLLAGCAAGSNDQQGAATGGEAIDIYAKIVQLDLSPSPYSTDYKGTMLVEVERVSNPAHTFEQAQLTFYKDTGMFKRVDDKLEPTQFEELAIGMMVEVRIDGPIAESYPVQATAGQIVIAEAASDDEASQALNGPGDVTGVVQEVDMQQKRVLIVDDAHKNGNTDNPVAVWVGLTEDGVLVRANDGGTIGFDEVAVGQKAVAWSIGEQLDSYPAQTSAFKIEIDA